MLNIYKNVVRLFVSIMGKARTWILKHRIISLIVAAAIGYVFANYACDIVSFCTPKKPVLESSITILALGLPTFFILWLFRTHDTQENINNSTFFECARLMTAEDSLSKKIALEQLAYLKRETSFDKKKIDLLTKNLFLNAKELNYAQLSGIDLSGAELKNTSLREADLRDAKLINADLSRDETQGQVPSGTDLSKADLRGADLRGANLSGVIWTTKPPGSGDRISNAELILMRKVNHMRKAAHSSKPTLRFQPILKDAIYNSQPIFTGTIIIGNTIFPDWLASEEKREEAKMIDISAKQGSPQNKSGSDG